MKQFSLFIIVVLLIACRSRVNPGSSDSANYSKLRETGWILGEWQKQSEKGILTETWKQLDDSTFTGRSFFVSNGDTVSSESIRLEQRNGKLYYVPTVRDQNNGLAVNFTLTSFTDSLLIFENPEHDFPQKITYMRVKDDSLHAEISAMVDGKLKSQRFLMGRAK